jgi:uncharacterized protein YgiM (DUF1202 family)
MVTVIMTLSCSTCHLRWEVAQSSREAFDCPSCDARLYTPVVDPKGSGCWSLFFVLLLLAAQLACMESAVLDPAPPTAVVSPGVPSPVALNVDEMIVVSAGLPSVFEPAFDMREVCAIELLNVRGGPGTQWPVIGQLKAGEVVRVREWSHNGNGWAMIAVVEWVNGDYLCL